MQDEESPPKDCAHKHGASPWVEGSIARQVRSTLDRDCDWQRNRMRCFGLLSGTLSVIREEFHSRLYSMVKTSAREIESSWLLGGTLIPSPLRCGLLRGISQVKTGNQSILPKPT